MSKKYGLRALRVVSLIVAVGLGGAPALASGIDVAAMPDSLPPGVTAAMIKQGYMVFHGEGLCINCHGEEAGGLVGPNLADSEWRHAKGGYLSIVQRILSGVSEYESQSGKAMPPKGGMNLTESDVVAVAAYVWRISHPRADTLPIGVTPPLVERGGGIFSRGDGCAKCHGVDAKGNVGPDLTDDRWLHIKGSYLSIARQIMNGVPADRSGSGVIMPPRGGSRISDSDVHSVAAYVWAVGRMGAKR